MARQTFATETGTSSDISPIERPTLHNVVVTRLRDMIIEGALQAGQRIHESRLCQQLGVSRTPLREALKVLASEGLVELVPGRGALVCQLTAKDVKDMLAVLGALEEFAGALTCQNASDHDIEEIRRLHDEMLQCHEKGDRLQYFKRNQRIHSLLIEFTRNESLAMLHDILQAKMRRIRYLGDLDDVTWAAAIADHEEMIIALEARDGARLAKALTDHLSRTWERVRNAL